MMLALAPLLHMNKHGDILLTGAGKFLFIALYLIFAGCVVGIVALIEKNNKNN